MRILFVAPGDNPHTWRWVGWFGKKYPGEVALIPYAGETPAKALPNVNIVQPFIPKLVLSKPSSWFGTSFIRRVIADINPQILHALWAYGPGTFAAGSDFHPFILSPWGSDITFYPKQRTLKGYIQRHLIIHTIGKADRITATSHYLADEIKSLVQLSREPDIFPYGVDTSVFHPRVNPIEFRWSKQAGSNKDAVTIGFFKALKYTYGPDYLLSSFAIALKEVPGLRLVMAGSGEMLENLQGEAMRLGIMDRICFPGKIPYSNMPHALAGIDIFVMPSRSESFGVAALEASAVAKPVVLSKTGGTLDVAEDGLTGFFVEPGDVKALAEQIVKLASDPALRKEMGLKGREFVKSRFELNDIMERADKYYSEIISGL